MKAVNAGSRNDCPVGWIAEGIAQGRHLGCDPTSKGTTCRSVKLVT
jgi:hypothetical protein